MTAAPPQIPTPPSPPKPTNPPKPQPTTQLRTRNNQRRSRARTKEYVEELEKRVHDLERLGIRASVEMQAATRKVARENVLLREMLGRCGVVGEEVEAFVRGEGRGLGNVAQTSRFLSKLHGRRRPEDDAPFAPTRRRRDVMESCYGLASTSADPSSSRMPHELAGPQFGSQSEPHPTSSVSTIHPSPSKSSPPRHGGQIFRPTETSGEVQTETSNDAMSCEAAASIIANLRGCDDNDDVRAELGCPSAEDCAVKNLTVFHAIDR